MLTQAAHAMPLSPAGYEGPAGEVNGVQFICWLADGWYVEGEDGETGPFDDLREAEIYCFGRNEK